MELATSERESAWKEMAQQVAHELRIHWPNALDLTDDEREKDIKEVRDMATNLLEEVENLTHIAEAFQDRSDAGASVGAFWRFIPDQ